MKRNSKRIGLIAILSLLFAPALAACDVTKSTPTSFCGVVLGNGGDNSDSSIHQVVLPGDSVNINDDKETTHYFPCNSRNYIASPEKDKGDTQTPVVAYTATGTKIKVWLTVAWTLNEDKDTLKKFYDFCDKYTCWSGDAKSGDEHSATPGWNNMLKENFPFVLDQTAQNAATSIGDEIWKNHDPKLYEQLASAMSKSFKDAMRARIGYSDDLFCGSGNSQWDKDKKNFTCSDVRILISDVSAYDDSLQATSDGSKSAQAQSSQDSVANEAEYQAALKLFNGDAAAATKYLQTKKAIEACQKDSNAKCSVVVGTGGVVSAN